MPQVIREGLVQFRGVLEGICGRRMPLRIMLRHITMGKFIYQVLKTPSRPMHRAVVS